MANSLILFQQRPSLPLPPPPPPLSLSLSLISLSVSFSFLFFFFNFLPSVFISRSPLPTLSKCMYARAPVGYTVTSLSTFACHCQCLHRPEQNSEEGIFRTSTPNECQLINFKHEGNSGKNCFGRYISCHDSSGPVHDNTLLTKTILAAVSLVFICLPSTKNLFINFNAQLKFYLRT